MSDYEPVYGGHAGTFTATAGGTIVGGQLLTNSSSGADNTVLAATAITNNVVGVAAHDAASGQRVTVWPLRGCIHELVADAAIATQGTVIGPPATTAGRVLTFASPTPQGFVGISLTGAAAAGNKLRVQC